MTIGVQIDISLVYFVYGLAFYSLGLILFRKSRRSPALANGRVLLALAIFGFIHGSHEWLEMVILKPNVFGVQASPQVAWLRLALLVCSFIALLFYAIQVLRPQQTLQWIEVVGVLGWGSIYILFIFITAWIANPTSLNLVEHADVNARYFLAVPGALLTAVALARQSRQARVQERVPLASSLGWAASGFCLYGLTQLVVPPVNLFPASWLNTTTFLAATGLPIQLIRAILAVWITASVMRATDFVERERQAELEMAQQARLQALEQIKQDLVIRESMRRELLQHIVMAQEEERARIARELHDETAQLLSAFNLNLAALSQYLPKRLETGELVERLQALNREMSQGIYRMVHDLRPAQLDDLGLGAALQYLSDYEDQHNQLKVTLEILGYHQRLNPVIETAVFRITQEALANVKRHAQTQEARVRLDLSGHQMVLNIEDNGVGFNIEEKLSPPRGWGLAGMRERAESVGGSIHFHSLPGRGTRIEVIIPLSPVDLLKATENVKSNENYSVDARG